MSIQTEEDSVMLKKKRNLRLAKDTMLEKLKCKYAKYVKWMIVRVYWMSFHAKLFTRAESTGERKWKMWLWFGEEILRIL